jgi:hypothetical protein
MAEDATLTQGGEDGYPSPDDVELAGFRDRIEQLDRTALSPEAIAETLYRPVPIDPVTGFYKGWVSGFRTGEVLRAQRRATVAPDRAFFVSGDVANIAGLVQLFSWTEADAHFSNLAAIFRAELEESGAVVVPMCLGGDEIVAIVVGDIDAETIASAVERVDTQAQEYVRQHNLSEIPNAKHPGQPEYNGVGLHLGYAEILPGLAVRDIFDAADLGVDRSKSRSRNVAAEQGRAAEVDRADSGAAAATQPGAATPTGRQTAGGQGEAAGRAGAQGQPAHPLSDRVRYLGPEELKRALFMDEAARIAQIGDAASEALVAHYEPLHRVELTPGFYDADREPGFVNRELARAREWVADTGTSQSAFLVSADLINPSGLSKHEAATAHYLAITEIFRTGLEETGAKVVAMRIGPALLGAVVVGTIDAATMDAAITEIDSKIGAYTRREGLADVKNWRNPERPGVDLLLGYIDTATHSDIDDIVHAARRAACVRGQRSPAELSGPPIVGYLDEHGNPLRPLTDASRQQAAEESGHAQSHRDAPDFDAIAFERELGDRLFHDPGANAAARRTVERLFDVMRVLHTELYPGTTPGRTEQIFFFELPDNPGQVEPGVVTLPELLREGNLRMVVTALLNALGRLSTDPMAVKATILELFNRPGWEGIAERAALDGSRLRALKEMADAGHDIVSLPALGSHSPDTRDAVSEDVASQAALFRRTLEEQEAYRWTLGEFTDRGMPLHPLEIAAQRRAESPEPMPGGTQIVGPVPEPAGSPGPRDVFDAPPTAQDWSQQITSAEQGAKPVAAPEPAYDPKERLAWVSGRARWGIDAEAPWFRAVSERGFPVTGGISGTAARLHSVFIWIRPEGISEHAFARALIGWMLPCERHSLYEIVRAIEVASPHLFHGPADRFADANDLYRRAPWISPPEEGEHRD